MRYNGRMERTLPAAKSDTMMFEPPPRRRWVPRLLRHPAGAVHIRMTREGLQLAFMLGFAMIAAVIQNVNLLVLVAGGLASLVFLQWRLCSRSLHRLKFSRRLPSRIEARRPFEVELIIHNPKKLLGAWWVNVLERTMPQSRSANLADGGSLNVLFERILPRASAVQRYDCTCPRRGRYRFLRPTLSTRFPLALLRAFRVLPTEEQYVVVPPVGQMRIGWQSLLRIPKSGLHEHQQIATGGDGEFFGLRQYRSGDSRRLIHWRSSAKRGELLVKQFEREDSFECQLVLDLSRPTETVAEEFTERIDVAVELLATLTTALLREIGGVATVTVLDGRPQSRLRIASSTHMPALFERLAEADSFDQTRLVPLLNDVYDTVTSRMPTIVVSLRSESELRRILGNRFEVLGGKVRWVDITAGEHEAIFRRFDDAAGDSAFDHGVASKRGKSDEPTVATTTKSDENPAVESRAATAGVGEG